MNGRVHIGVAAVCSCIAIAGVSYNVSASSLCSETEIAGISVMLDSYYSACGQVASVDPESVVPVDYIDSDDPEETYSSTYVFEPVGVGFDDNIQIETGADSEDAAEAASEEVPVDGSVPEDAAVDGNVPADAAVQDVAAQDQTAVTDGAIDVADPAVTPEPVSSLADVGISIANEYVNIRKKPNTDSKILGKLYRGSAAKIVNTKGEWVEIKSGSVKGYIKSEYLAIGFDAEKLVNKYGTKLATVNTTTLKVREERNTDCTVLTLVPEGETFEVLKEYKDWVKILVDDSTKGYVAKEYVTLEVEFEEAISIEEEKAKEEAERLAREAEEEAARQEAARIAAARQEAARQQEAARRQAASRRSSSGSSSSRRSSSSSSSSRRSSSGSSSHKSSSGKSSYSGGSSSADGTSSSAADYAQNFIGNKYVYGGTSLTNGTDCSGFVKSVYSKYGVDLPRTSSEQSNVGKSVSLDNLQKGDLVFYSSGGSVNHVAMYIGDGKVVHASNKRDGIKVSKMNYRTPAKARRVSN